MKRILAALLLTLALGACSESGPTKTAKAFTTHIAAGEVQQAVPYLATEIRAVMGDAKLTMALREASGQNKHGVVKRFRAVSEEVNGERAKGTYMVRFDDGTEEETKYDFVKEEKEWKIYIEPRGK